MAKANPLFIDSTKMTGDSIGTQFEVSRVAVYENETLVVLITNHLNEVTRTPLNINADLEYQTRVWLGHQKTFTYQFAIEKGGQRILQSVPKKARAQYAILEKWEPVLAEPDAVVEAEAGMTDLQTTIPEHAKTVARLIEKFGF